MNWVYGIKIAGLIIGIGLVVALIIILLSKYFKHRKRKIELRKAAEKQIREESLEQMILNEHNVPTQRGKAHNPYEVSYEKGVAPQMQRTTGQIRVSLEENNSLSVKKFVFNPSNIIRIGSGLRGNDVVVQGEGIAECHCEIFAVNQKVYVRNRAVNYTTILKHKRKKMIVDNNGMRIQTGDVIFVGEVAYKVTLICS